MRTRTIRMTYGAEGMDLRLPADATVLTGQHPPAVPDVEHAIRAALAGPIGSPPLADLLAGRRPRTVAITISDITRPVPNAVFLPVLLDVINRAGIGDDRIVIIVGTGMHRPSTPDEHEMLVGRGVLERVEVIDHRADDPATLATVSEDPPVRVCRRFVQADFRIVTGFIEPHFMAGFSGGRKGVCPALVDLRTVQRFHGYPALAAPEAREGALAGNPCHAIALAVARAVGVDFLFNVAVTGGGAVAGIYCGDLEAAHAAGCRQVGRWTGAPVEGPFDLVVTTGGGAPLDATFYQTVKGMVTALPALGEHSTLLQVSRCDDGVGSAAYTDLMLRYAGDWRRFLADIAAEADRTALDQWEYQMQARVLARIGVERLWFASDGLDLATQRCLSVTPLAGDGPAAVRAQRAIDAFVAARPGARVAVIPEGPYTMLHPRGPADG
ncbi:MAG: nickel-dependent lactate racemase [Planctomycetes bacterium]|nr:nickel-dependent lactate racemase [Planctomycetota bacterium]